MGEHASGYFEYRSGDGESWVCESQLGFRNRGLGHQHLFGWEHGKDIPVLSGQPRGWPDEDTMSEEVKSLYERHRKGPRFTGGWVNITYITGADVPRVDEAFLNADWVAAVEHLDSLATQYGAENARLVVYFTT